MPGLVAFGRRWGIGSDDLVLPAVVELLVRLSWLIPIAAVFAWHHSAVLECNGREILKIFYIGALVIICCHIVLVIGTGYFSTRGTILNVRPRRHITKFLYMRLALFGPELVWNVLGAIWAFDESLDCDTHVVWTVKGVVISMWVLLLGVVIGLLIVFDPLGKKPVSIDTPRTSPREQENLGQIESGDGTQMLSGLSTATSRVWRNRMKVICCCVGCDENSRDAFTEIGNLFSSFFQDIDLVPTDIAAGLVLLQIQQEQDENRLSSTTSSPRGPADGNNDSTLQDRIGPSQYNASTSPRGLAPPNSTPKDWMTIDMMAHYIKFALASYGWPLYMFTHLFTGLCHLGAAWRCCSCMVPGANLHVVEDNCCQCHTAAIKKIAQIATEDIVYASFHNKVYEIPFFVALDHEHRTVVVAVRGTLSFRDVLTDLTADDEDVQVSGCEGTCAHRGMLRAAQFVQKKLEEKMILLKAFEKAPGYKLMLTGHSLGAGTAALLAMLLKPTYPDLMCFSFSPPGGLMSLPLSKYSEEFICSVILGKDLVPRLGMMTMEDMKVKLLRIIRDSNKPKHQIFATGCWNAFCKKGRMSVEEAERSLLDQTNTVTSYSSTVVKEIDEALQVAIMTSGQSRVTQRYLYPPGQIMHIQEAEPSTACYGLPTYTAVWSNALNFSQVLVHPRMVPDHMPDAVMKALDQLKDNKEPIHTDSRHHIVC